MIRKEDLFIGLRLKCKMRRIGSPILIVTEITDRGFKYTWAERLFYGARYGYSDRGEAYETSFEQYEITDTGQRPD